MTEKSGTCQGGELLTDQTISHDPKLSGQKPAENKQNKLRGTKLKKKGLGIPTEANEKVVNSIDITLDL